MAANVKNFGYVLSKAGSDKVSEIKPVGKAYIEECKKAAERYPQRERREVKK